MSSIYETLSPFSPLAQGELIDSCPILAWVREEPSWVVRESFERVLVLTQACDLENDKTTRVQVAIVHPAETLVAAGLLKPNAITDQVRRHRVYGWYFLPAGPGVDESIVDLRDVHTIPKALVTELVLASQRVVALKSPYREHLAQHFSVTYSRIGLPEPYETD